MKPIKPWRCRRCGAVLGMVVRMGDGSVRLLLYRRAVGEDHGQEVEVMAVVEGQVFDVVCSGCESVRTWWSERPPTRPSP